MFQIILAAVTGACLLAGCATSPWSGALRSPGKGTHGKADSHSKKSSSLSIASDPESAHGLHSHDAEIRSLIDKACAASYDSLFDSANIWLNSAAALIREINEAQDTSDGLPEDYFAQIAGIYVKSMPAGYLDSLPDEIAMSVYRIGIAQTLDSLRNTGFDHCDLLEDILGRHAADAFKIEWNERVHDAFHVFSHSRSNPRMEQLLKRTNFYAPYIAKKLLDAGLPEDLAYLPFIESGYNCQAYSYKRASGPWQFIEATGKRFGLTVNKWIDERRSFVKSTDAAIAYLKILYAEFGDWHLAIAAYNCGENRVRGTITRSGSKDFWVLNLPPETRGYVPQFIAALIFIKSANKIGYGAENTESFETAIDTAYMSGFHDLQTIANDIGVPLKTLTSLNPHILRWCIPPGTDQTILCLPAGTKARLNREPVSPAQMAGQEIKTYTIKKGDNLWNIARLFRVSVDDLCLLNGISKAKCLKPGEEILIDNFKKM